MKRQCWHWTHPFWRLFRYLAHKPIVIHSSVLLQLAITRPTYLQYNFWAKKNNKNFIFINKLNVAVLNSTGIKDKIKCRFFGDQKRRTFNAVCSQSMMMRIMITQMVTKTQRAQMMAIELHRRHRWATTNTAKKQKIPPHPVANRVAKSRRCLVSMMKVINWLFTFEFEAFYFSVSIFIKFVFFLSGE